MARVKLIWKKKKKKKKNYIFPLTCNAKEDNIYHNQIQGKPYTCEFNERARNPHPHTVSYIFFCVCDIFTDPEKDTSEKDTCYTDSCYTEPCSTDSCHTDTNQGKPKCALMCLQDQWCQSIKDGIGDSGYAERGFFLIRDMGPWLSRHWNPCSLYMRKMVLHVGFCRMATEISPFLISPPGGSN